MFKNGDIAYIIETNRKIRKVHVIRAQGDRYYVKFDDCMGGACLKDTRLFKDAADAMQYCEDTRIEYKRPLTYEDRKRKEYLHYLAILT